VNSRFTFKPGDLPGRVKTEIDTIGRRVFEVSRAKDYARIDMMVSEEDGCPCVLEINAVPGLKHGSLYPYGAALHGITEDECMETILRNAVLEENYHV
jgi:D-alanine-D-alanine ligase-like ATP-grasp enzyme